MNLFQAVLACLPCSTSDDHEPHNDKFHNALNEKNRFEFMEKDKVGRNAQDIATDIVNALYSAEKHGDGLQRALDDIVGEYGWVENLGVAILNTLEKALMEGVAMGQVMKEAFDKASSAAVGFARDHPVFCTLIALGILALLTPWVIEAIGFGELGPIQGKNGTCTGCTVTDVSNLRGLYRLLCCILASQICRVRAEELAVFILSTTRDEVVNSFVLIGSASTGGLICYVGFFVYLFVCYQGSTKFNGLWL